MSPGTEDVDAFETSDVPPLYLGSNAPIDKGLALNINIVAKTTVDDVVRGAVEELVQTVASATQWLADAVQGELISQAVTTAASATALAEKNNTSDSSSPVTLLCQDAEIVARPSSTAIHAVAKAAVDAVMLEAAEEILLAVEKATQWITQAVESELVSEAMDPEEGIAIQNATEWITQAVRSEVVAHAVADAIPSTDTSTTIFEEQITADVSEAPTHRVPRLVFQDELSSLVIRELAKLTAEVVVRVALQNVAQAIGDANNDFFVQALTDTSTTSFEENITADVSEAPTHGVPRLVFQVQRSAAAIRELAKLTTEAAVRAALQNVAQAIGDASKWLTQAVHDDLLAQAVIDASPYNEPQIEEMDNILPMELKETEQLVPLRTHEAIHVTAPELQVPSSEFALSEAVTEFPVPFVSEIVPSAPHDAVPVSSPEPEDEAYEDEYTPINTPTAEASSSQSPLTTFVPPLIISARATPPDTTPSSRCGIA
ncbi:unnamed protein product [Phytophthora fragariaefolia]|uniref:Unnamed protein product n=1 Tax=Phytophthora fragariaefolia TaxID=1490495 RepID=A0A9W7CUZ5_9STRA|nr:unnamed protein product [Phytophthora fragariaefolia]